MPTTRCPQCGKKIDTSFYGSCIDCGILLSEAANPAASVTVEPGHDPKSLTLRDDSGQDSLLTQPPASEDDSGESASREPTDRRSTGKRIAGGIGAGLLVRLILAGLIIGGGALWGAFTSADRDSQGSIADSGSLNADELQVGDCLDWPGGRDDEVELFDSVDAHPCVEPHDLEVFATVEYPSAQGVPYPGDEWITDFGFDECLTSFEPYVGAAYSVVPDIDITIFWPSEESWNADDRTIHCLLFPIDDGVRLFGTLRGREA